jgi:hypothetical protein
MMPRSGKMWSFFAACCKTEKKCLCWATIALFCETLCARSDATLTQRLAKNHDSRRSLMILELHLHRSISVIDFFYLTSWPISCG